MTFPAFLFGSLIAILIASLFHLIVGGNLKKYGTYLFFAWFGFWLGYYLSNRIVISVWRVGIFDMGICIACSILIILFIYWIDNGSDDTEESKEKD